MCMSSTALQCQMLDELFCSADSVQCESKHTDCVVVPGSPDVARAQLLVEFELVLAS